MPLTLALLLALVPPVNVDSILREMADLDRLAHRPVPAYTTRQWTSYDRSPAPFANGDAGHFLRSEGNERVMADAKGPGAMVRLWSANPTGTLRFYFDGEAKPRLVADMAALLSGRHPLFPEPFAYVAARGCNLYFPMPYAKGLKVTWEGAANAGLYYAVGTRAYAPGTAVETFTTESVESARSERAEVARALNVGDPPGIGGAVAGGRPTPPGGSVVAEFSLDPEEPDGAEIRQVRIFSNDFVDRADAPWDDPHRLHNVLRRLRFKASFDGETTVDVPLGDLFGATLRLARFQTLPISVFDSEKGGGMSMRWVMPYRRKARIWIENGNAFPVTLFIGIKGVRQPFTPGTYLFHARWHAQTRRTRPMYEFNFLDVKGEGRLVGVGLQVSNPVATWWGEGDEKVYVDGEAFPSLFGTGTEDYFGYAWSDPTPFARPYHAQPRTANLGNLGQTENLRFHIVDDIPFTKGLRFDMEAWHWADVTCTYATTAYWYALPGTTPPDAPDSRTLLVPEVPLPKPVVGAIEGEDLSWTTTGGTKEVQGGFAELSGGRQLWWRGASVGATASVLLRVPAAGRYEVVANLGHARDYGRFRVSVGSGPAKEIDLYRPELAWRRESLGTFDLPAGKATIRFEVLGANPKSVPGANMLGVDYFLLRRL